MASCGSCYCIPGNDGTDPCPSWKPQTNFSESIVEAFKSKTLLNPFEDLVCNPYEDLNCTTSPSQQMVGLESAVCAFHYSNSLCDQYKMATYDSWEAAVADGAFVTHTGSKPINHAYTHLHTDTDTSTINSSFLV
jgi:hypothetical protein